MHKIFLDLFVLLAKTGLALVAHEKKFCFENVEDYADQTVFRKFWRIIAEWKMKLCWFRSCESEALSVLICILLTIILRQPAE